MKENDDVALPFESTVITNIGDDVYRKSGYFPQLLFLLLLISFSGFLVFLYFFYYIFINIESHLVNIIGLSGICLIMLFGFPLGIMFFIVYKALKVIPSSILPLRSKVKIEMMPLQNNDVLHEYYLRLCSIFQLKKPTEEEDDEEDSTIPIPPTMDVKTKKKIFNRTIKGKKNQHQFGIFTPYKDNIGFFILTMI